MQGAPGRNQHLPEETFECTRHGKFLACPICAWCPGCMSVLLAREALLAGPVETAAYLLDEGVEDVRRVAGENL